MKNRNRKKKILLMLLLFFLVIQAIQPSRNKGATSGPEDITRSVQVPDTVMAVLRNSCYDCHSDSTAYPWYSYITPVNWWLANHVHEGKEELNFSRFTVYEPRKKVKKLKEIAETVEKGEMPLQSFLLAHNNARLSEAQKQLLVEWAKQVAQKNASQFALP